MSTPEQLNAIVKKNLAYFMALPSCAYKNPNALAEKAEVASNTIRNLLDPTKRTLSGQKKDGYPTIETLAAIAPHLGCEVWELLHPNIERSRREREMYRHIESDFNRLKAKQQEAA